MAHINPQLPADGQQNWAATADSFLNTLVAAINLHDDLIATLTGSGGIVDNGNGTITILPAPSASAASTTVGTIPLAFDTDGVPYLSSF